jgi:radical SAM-linked protein
MRIRLRYEKTEAGRFLSHLDLARTMERTLRRAEVPLAFSEGFNPHPRMSFASALAVGITGENEFLDVELRRRVNPDKLEQAIREAMPPALILKQLQEVPMHGKSLSALINQAVYRFLVPEGRIREADVQAGIDRLLAAAELWRQPKIKPGKKPIPAKEVRGLVRWITVSPENGWLKIEMALVMSNAAQLRPQEVWAMLAEFGGFEAETIRQVCRTGLYIEEDGKAYTPMGGDHRDAQRDSNEGGGH